VRGWLAGIALGVNACSHPFGHGSYEPPELACEATRSFVRSDTGDRGLRYAHFFDESDGISFWQAMSGDPWDDQAMEFYQGAGALTHYLGSSDFARALGSCLDRESGFRRTEQTPGIDEYEAKFVDQDTKRRVVIASCRSSTGILVADETWTGNLTDTLIDRVASFFDCDQITDQSGDAI
jgi:hypothetical protein